MSLILKGIDLPKNFPMHITIEPNGEITRTDGHIFSKHGRAIQIPKGHGRLIDADELAEHMKRDNPQTSKAKWMEILVKYAPTILEEEE